MLIRQTLLYMPAQIGGPSLQFLMTILLTYWLVPAQFGELTAMIAAQELAYLIFVFWWSSAALRYSEEIIEQDGRVKFQAMENMILLVASLLQISLVSCLLMTIKTEVTFWDIFWYSLFVITRSLISHLSERARAGSKILIYTSLQLLPPIISLLLAYLAFFRFNSSLQVLLASFAIAQTSIVLIVWYWLSLGLSFAYPDRIILFRSAKFGFPLMVGGFLGWFSLNAIRIIIGYLYGSDKLGLLSVGWGLGQRFASVAAMMVTAAAFPLAVARMKLGSKQSSLNQMSVGGMLLFALLSPSTAGLAWISSSLVELTIAEPFRLMTITVLPLAMLASAIRNFRVHYPDQSLLLLEVTSLTIAVNLFEAIITILLCYLGGIIYGPIGAVYGCVLGSGLGCLVGFIIPVVLHSLPIFWNDFLKILFATISMIILLSLLDPLFEINNLYLRLAQQISFSICVYTLLMLCLYFKGTCRMLKVGRSDTIKSI